jgi:hypothetical protein
VIVVLRVLPISAGNQIYFIKYANQIGNPEALLLFSPGAIRASNRFSASTDYLRAINMRLVFKEVVE